MNREIKFRSKELGTGQWVYGSLLQDDYGTFKIVSFIDHHETWHDVDPDTIGQFTGLYDCNGTEIYEDDIVQCDDWFNSEVFYHDDLGAFVVDNPHKQMINLMSDFRKIQVVGNIHDNPELIKGE